MQNILAVWAALDMRRRMIVVAATVAMFAAVLALSQMAQNPRMTLLYAGLDGAAAGDVVAALEQRGVVYEVRGDAIYVDSAERDSLRMTLASEGLPANGGTGYELLDSLSGFGTTSQMFDAAYWRAKEGELARTILSNSQIRAARVHIAKAPTELFQPDAQPTASVTVTTGSGNLSADQARALRHLVAAAVSGMKPEDVQVIDTVAGLIGSDSDETDMSTAGDSKAAEIRRNVERLLEARVGAGKAVVEVAVEIVSERESISERKFDPQGRVAISQETEEKSDSSTGAAGQVTVSSNLPEGDTAAGDGPKSEGTQTRETVNYEVSETQRDLLKVPGDIRRLSVAVLVDEQSVTAEDGTVSIQPRSEEELAVLRELVASAVGLNEERGDVLTLKSLAFQPIPLGEGPLSAGLLPEFGPIDLMTVIQLVALSLVALVLGVFVIRPILTAPRNALAELPAPGAPLALPGASPGEGDVLEGEIAEDFPMMGFMGGDMDSPELPDDPVSRLRRLIEERQAESVEILRGWMESAEEEKA